MGSAPQVFVSGSFDDLRSRQVRLLEEAAQWGPLHVLLWSDRSAARLTGKTPKFPEAERLYLVGAIRYVNQVTLVEPTHADALPCSAPEGSIWAVDAAASTPAEQAHCQARGIAYRPIAAERLAELPAYRSEVAPTATKRPRVIVTGCYDWFHSGHVRFFEEVAELGDLYVIVGHDANIRLLKGEGHPLFSQRERWYLVHSVRHVHQALISSGDGWLDAEPEIERIRPHIYAVNEDGDRPEKAQYCAAHGIEYRVLKRAPKEGLPPRQSTSLRGF